MEKKEPLRQCLGCREHKPKSGLIRVVKSPKGEVSVDYAGKKPGRGAYICTNNDCLKRVIKTNALSRALKVKIPENILNGLLNAIGETEKP